MNFTINNVAKHHCSGCGACKITCPAGAITIKSNDEGYLFPEIDKSKCINCGLCYKKCPAVNFDKFEDDKPTVYAMMAQDEIRKTSSSGGMFSCLAEYVFDKKGVVCGVSNKSPFKLEFTFAENLKELEKIKGSKYFQAEVGDTYKYIKNYLEEGRYVLFCACPCQVAGIKNFLGKSYSNLILADVVCHGVLSSQMVEKYVSTLANINDVESLKFRDKEVYKWSTNITLQKKDKDIIRRRFNESSFYSAFGSGIAMRESCYNCKFAKIPRVGDFTLADYWHISEFNKDVNDWQGTSCVLLNNEKAEIIYHEVEPKMKKSALMPFDTAIKYNTQLREPIKRNPNRDLFYQKIKTENFDDALNYCLNKTHFDVGLIGYWYATNYGSVITYYALYKAIENMGYKTVILDRPDKLLDKEPQNVFPRQFMNRFANVSDSYSHFEQGKFNNLCDKFVIGSDQVWTKGAIMNTGYRFFLDFVSDEKTKVAYAPSFGQDSFDALPETKRIVSYLLSRFDAISVRENTGVDICKREFNIDADWMIDPIFLQNKEFYESIADYSNKNESEPYMLSYILDPDEDKKNMLLYSQNKKNLKLINLLDGRYNTFDANNKKLNLPNTPKDVNEEEWVRYFKNAEFVVTDSHHGFAMAVIFNKPVICIMNKSRGGTRFTSLLGWLGMLDRLVDKSENLADKDYLFNNYDYSKVNLVIEQKRKKSLDWLKNGLAKEHNNPSSIYDFVNGRLKEMERKIAELKHQNLELKNQLGNVDKRGN